jgi:hypothetical protein
LPAPIRQRVLELLGQMIERQVGNASVTRKETRHARAGESEV